MKKLIALFTLVCLTASAQRTPLNRAFLQSDLDGNQKKITNMLFSGSGNVVFVDAGGNPSRTNIVGVTYFNLINALTFAPQPTNANLTLWGALAPSAFITNNWAGGLITNNGTVWLSTNGTPTISLPDGSFATVTDGRIYLRTNGTWTLLSTGSGGGGSFVVAAAAPITVSSNNGVVTIGLTNSPSPYTISNFTFGGYWTNKSSNTVILHVPVKLVVAAVSGVAAVDLQIDGTGGHSFSLVDRKAVTTFLASIAGETYTNSLFCVVTNGGCVTVTNTSTGAGNSSALDTTYGVQISTLGSGAKGDTGAAGSNATGNANPRTSTNNWFILGRERWVGQLQALVGTAGYTAIGIESATYGSAGVGKNMTLGEEIVVMYPANGTNAAGTYSAFGGTGTSQRGNIGLIDAQFRMLWHGRLTNTSNVRVLIGLMTNQVAADIGRMFTNSQAKPTNFLGFRYDTSASDVNWMAYSIGSDGVTGITDTGIAVTTNYVSLDFENLTNGASVVYYVDGVARATNSGHLPPSGAALKPIAGIASLTSAVNSLYTSRIYTESFYP